MGFSYATTGDIQRHLPGRNFEEAVAGKSITISQLEDFLQQIAVDIDAHLEALDFTLPVTASENPSGYLILSEINALGAAALAEEAIVTVRGGASDRADRLRERYERALQDIADRVIDLVDVPGGPLAPAEAAYSGSLEPDEAGRERPIFFERQMEW